MTGARGAERVLTSRSPRGCSGPCRRRCGLLNGGGEERRRFDARTRQLAWSRWKAGKRDDIERPPCSSPPPAPLLRDAVLPPWDGSGWATLPWVTGPCAARSLLHVGTGRNPPAVRRTPNQGFRQRPRPPRAPHPSGERTTRDRNKRPRELPPARGGAPICLHLKPQPLLLRVERSLLLRHRRARLSLQLLLQPAL